MLMHFFGKAIKYLLRSVFSIVVFVLLVGLAKTHWNISTYINFLDTQDWSAGSSSATWIDLFWPNTQISGDIADIISDDTQLSGLDVYDPMLEDELNEFSDGSLSGSEEGEFGFTTETTITGTHNSSEDSSSSDISTTSKTELLNLIKQRELTK